MFIKSDYKDLYFIYIRGSGYSPASIRILRSDILSLFTWLHALDYSVPRGDILKEYEKFLILNKTPHQTISRKISSVKKFIHWTYSEFQELNIDSKAAPYHREPVRSIRVARYSRRNLLLFFSFTVVFLSLSALVWLFVFPAVLEFPLTTSKNTFSHPNSFSLMRFSLNLYSPNRYLASSKDTLQFKLYRQDDFNSVIGYILCPLTDTVIPRGSSRLQIDIGSNCSPISDEIKEKIGRGDAISADIYLNSQKLTESKIVISDQNTGNNDSSYQYALHGGLSEPSNDYVKLPDISTSGDVLGLEITNQAFLPHAIPFSLLQSSSIFHDGDIVSIYNGDLVRALLSTKVLGVVSGNSVITQGVAYVRMIQSPDTIISSGDYISTSVQAGYGQKANTPYDSIIGIALEPLLPGNEYLKILVSLP